MIPDYLLAVAEGYSLAALGRTFGHAGSHEIVAKAYDCLLVISNAAKK
jgi:hypothetical protein